MKQAIKELAAATEWLERYVETKEQVVKYCDAGQRVPDKLLAKIWEFRQSLDNGLQKNRRK